MDSRPVKDLLDSTVRVHFSGLHLNDLEARKSAIPLPIISKTEEMERKPFVIGVAGGAASGKTIVCDMIIQQLRDQRVVLITQESFYRSLSKEEVTKVCENNFDHHDAMDTDKLLHCMECLKNGQDVDIPNYDCRTCRNILPARKISHSDIIILEGILCYDQKFSSLIEGDKEIYSENIC